VDNGNLGSEEFLSPLNHLNRNLIVSILHEQSGLIGKTLAELLAVVKQKVPNFVQLIADSSGVGEPG